MKRILLILVSLAACTFTKHSSVQPKTETELRIIEAMRGPVERDSGVKISFTGQTKVSGDWAYFDGHAIPADGSEPLENMSLDFAALLHRDTTGVWHLLEHGFSGDPSLLVHLRRSHPKAPASVFPANTDNLVKHWPAEDSRESWDIR